MTVTPRHEMHTQDVSVRVTSNTGSTTWTHPYHGTIRSREKNTRSLNFRSDNNHPQGVAMGVGVSVCTCTCIKYTRELQAETIWGRIKNLTVADLGLGNQAA